MRTEWYLISAKLLLPPPMLFMLPCTILTAHPSSSPVKAIPSPYYSSGNLSVVGVDGPLELEDME